MEMTIMKEEIVFTHRSRETEGMTCHAGPHEEALDWLEVGGSKEEIQARAFIMVSSRKGVGGRAGKLRVGHIEKFQGTMGYRRSLLAWYLASGD